MGDPMIDKIAEEFNEIAKGYPPGYDWRVHSELPATVAATTVIEASYRIMDAVKKQKKIEEYTEMISKTRKAVLELSRKHHPSQIESRQS